MSIITGHHLSSILSGGFELMASMNPPPGSAWAHVKARTGLSNEDSFDVTAADTGYQANFKGLTFG